MNRYLPYFFGPQADYYMLATEELQEGKVQFNGMAFLGGVLWMGYRKMYWQACLTAAIILGENLIEAMLWGPRNQNDSSSIIISLLVNAIIGVISNQMYVNYASRQVNKIVAEHEGASEEQLIALISERGGVTWYGPFIVLTIVFIGTAILLTFANMGGVRLR